MIREAAAAVSFLYKRKKVNLSDKETETICRRIFD
nr:MAG TPA: hypothetical protein [Caudoviricetes sp.]